MLWGAMRTQNVTYAGRHLLPALRPCLCLLRVCCPVAALRVQVSLLLGAVKHHCAEAGAGVQYPPDKCVIFSLLCIEPGCS